MATNPMHQFQVHKIGPEIKIAGVDLSFTNASLFMLLSALTICVVLCKISYNQEVSRNTMQLKT